MRAAELRMKHFAVPIKPVPTFELAGTDPLFIYALWNNGGHITFSLMVLLPLTL